MLNRPAYPEVWARPATTQAPQLFQGMYASQIVKIIDGKFSTSDTVATGWTALSFTSPQQFRIDSVSDPATGIVPGRLYPSTAAKTKIRVTAKSKGILITYRSKEMLAGNPFLGFSRTYNLFTKLEDGSISVKSGDWFLGLVMMIVPFYGTEYSWIRISKDSISVVEKKSVK